MSLADFLTGASSERDAGALAVQHFSACDANQDFSLSETEISQAFGKVCEDLGVVNPYVPGTLMGKFDKSGDGKVSLVEFSTKSPDLIDEIDARGKEVSHLKTLSDSYLRRVAIGAFYMLSGDAETPNHLVEGELGKALEDVSKSINLGVDKFAPDFSVATFDKDGDGMVTSYEFMKKVIGLVGGYRDQRLAELG